MKVGLEEVVSYFPDTIVKKGDLAYLDEFIPKGDEDFFEGPDEFRRLRDNNATEILAENVAKKALDKSQLQPSDIDYIIAANIGGKHILPMVGPYIHDKLGFPEDIPVLNIQNVCASFVDGINIAWDMILSGRNKRVLVVTVTAVATKGWGVDQTNPLAKFFGDGSAAAIVSSENLKCEFLSYQSRTFGAVYDHMTMDLMPIAHPELKVKTGVEADVGIFLFADEWVFEHWEGMREEIAVEGIDKALRKAGLSLPDLDMVAIHHPQSIMHSKWIEFGDKAGVPKEKWKELWNKLGNCGNVDIPAVLSDLSEKGQIPKDSVIALFPPGLGGHFPCMIIRWLV